MSDAVNEPMWNDEVVHYMESTSRLRAENEELRRSRDALDRSDRTKGRQLADAWCTINQIEGVLTEHGVAITHPLSDAVLEQLATMREVAEEVITALHKYDDDLAKGLDWFEAVGEHPADLVQRVLAAHLDPPPVVENPPA